MSELTEEQRQRAVQVMQMYLNAPARSNGKTPSQADEELDVDRATVIDQQLRPLLGDYFEGKVALAEFKSRIDGINKRHEHWGFKGVKGQMFFNVVVNVAAAWNLNELDAQLKVALAVPSSEDMARSRIETFASYVRGTGEQHAAAGGSKHGKPNVGSVLFFVSYFWQIQERHKWPIYYTNSVKVMTDLNLWKPSEDLPGNYVRFKRIHDELATLFTQASGRQFSLYDVEHVFWVKGGKAYSKTNGELEEEEEEPESTPEYSLDQVADETGLEKDTLRRWVRALERKGQAIIYGPPGTGKTFVGESLARHLVSGSDGLAETVQFHPAYNYEDFVIGIRPKTRPEGGLEYPLVPGRFLDFCAKAAPRKGRCVLIVDEINRANLARVLGELMYLLEYREREIPLATGKRFRIPRNVRVIGTMNTADRSIALVDHALRRRFAFLALRPNYDILKKFHKKTGVDVEGLISVLRNLNAEIGDYHYEVGVSFFLLNDLASQVEDIWRMEIEPYLEEYFFDQPDKVARYRWEQVRDRIRL